MPNMMERGVVVLRCGGVARDRRLVYIPRGFVKLIQSSSSRREYTRNARDELAANGWSTDSSDLFRESGLHIRVYKCVYRARIKNCAASTPSLAEPELLIEAQWNNESRRGPRAFIAGKLSRGALCSSLENVFGGALFRTYVAIWGLNKWRGLNVSSKVTTAALLGITVIGRSHSSFSNWLHLRLDSATEIFDTAEPKNSG